MMPENAEMDARSWRHTLSPSFLVCVLLLVAVALGLRPGMARLAQSYRKESIALRKPLDQVDFSRMVSFRKVPVILQEEVSLKETGTDDVVLVQFLPNFIAQPRTRIALLVTYYSSAGDKVPHTPEVCYRQGGSIVEQLTTTTVDTPELSPKSPQTEVRLLRIRQETTSAVILYVFYASGRFCWDREQVRWVINQPGDRRVYFSKVEVIVPVLYDEDPASAVECGKRCMREILPILIADHFPTDDQLK